MARSPEALNALSPDERRVFVECHDCEEVRVGDGWYGTCADCFRILLGFVDVSRDENVAGLITDDDEALAYVAAAAPAIYGVSAR